MVLSNLIICVVLFPALTFFEYRQTNADKFPTNYRRNGCSSLALYLSASEPQMSSATAIIFIRSQTQMFCQNRSEEICKISFKTSLGSRLKPSSLDSLGFYSLTLPLSTSEPTIPPSSMTLVSTISCPKKKLHHQNNSENGYETFLSHSKMDNNLRGSLKEVHSMAGQSSGTSEEIDNMVIKVPSKFRVHTGLKETEEKIPRRLSPEVDKLESTKNNPSSEHLLEDGPSTDCHGAQHSEESDEEEEENKDEGREVTKWKMESSDPSNRAAQRFRKNGTCSWPQGDNSEDVTLEESTEGNVGRRPFDPQLRRGTSLISSIDTEVTPDAIRSVIWKGSSEFNFRLPRNTGREVSWLEESIPYGLESIQESSNLAWNGAIEAIPALLSSRNSGQPINSCIGRQVTKALQSSLSQLDQNYNTPEILDNSHISHGDDKDLVPPLPNILPSGQFDRSLETTSTALGRTDPRAPNHCSKVHLLPGNIQSSATSVPADAFSCCPVGPLSCCSLKEAPGGRKSLLHQSNNSCDSMFYHKMEHDTISQIIEKARESAGMEARSKFKNSSDLVHQLFVCISIIRIIFSSPQRMVFSSPPHNPSLALGKSDEVQKKIPASIGDSQSYLLFASSKVFA